jgi:hypothetical protein
MLFKESSKNCTKLCQKLEAKGISAEIIYTGGNFYNVLIPVNNSVCLLMSEEDTEKAKTVCIYDKHQRAYLATLCQDKTNWLNIVADFVEANQ